MFKKTICALTLGLYIATASGCDTKGTYLPNSELRMLDEGVQISIPYHEERGDAFDIGDWDGDGDIDLLVGHPDGRVYLRELMDDGSVRSEFLFRLPYDKKGGYSIAMYDANGDEYMDILASNGSGSVRLYTNQSGNFTED